MGVRGIVVAIFIACEELCMPKNKQKRAKRPNDHAEAAVPESKPAPSMPAWLRRAACFFGALFCAFGVVYCTMVLLVGEGSPVFIVAIIVFAAMAVHLVRAGLSDGRWRAGR